MNKILKILSILVIGFVMFSCSTPTNDPVEETPEEPTYSIQTTKEPLSPSVEETPDTYSITFKNIDTKNNIKFLVDYLNNLPEFKNLEEGDEVFLLQHLYTNDDESQITKEIVETTVCDYGFCYDNNVTSVVVGNENIEVNVKLSSLDTYDN